MLSHIEYTPEDADSKGGSNLLEFRLTLDQAKEAWGVDDADPLALAGWHKPFKNLVGGTIGENPTATERYDEADNLVSITVTGNQFTLANGSMSVDPALVRFVRWLRKNAVPMRYFLPTGADGTFRTNADGDRVGHLVANPAVRASYSQTQMQVSREQSRDLPLEIVGGRNVLTGEVYDYETVNLDDQTAWPTSVAYAKDVV